ncbi:MAG: MgtC/SapB family protein [Lachnospiraceae bacterium]|nr:MgtC/SapB family protein [Lachnospiraceae bacterium]
MYGQNLFNDIFGLPFQGELVLRLIVSCLAGAVIGYERRKREKVAGMRTHIIAALASTLFSICSKYSYFDVVMYDGVSIDASRIAANIVTGICFLGAGMIILKNKTIKGLTTSAGIWAVSAIGMAFGNGMYILALSSTVIMIFIQYTLHNSLDNFEGRQATECFLVIQDGEKHMEELLEDLKKKDESIRVMSLTKEKDGNYAVKIGYHPDRIGIDKDVWSFMKGYPYVISCNI